MKFFISNLLTRCDSNINHRKSDISSNLTIMSHLFHKYFSRAAVLLLGAATLGACSDSFLFDEEGDCDPYYKARFVFDYNMLYADAFPRQVNAVTLYLIDPESGKIVWQKSESGEALSSDGYMMDIDVAPGRYSLLAWCGEGVGENFSVADSEVYTGLKCSLNHSYGSRSAIEGDHHYCDKHIKRLYHGRVLGADGKFTDEPQIFPDDEGVHVFPIHLVKNTNDVNILLQQLSGEPVEKDSFTFTIGADNGSMDWDNTVIPQNEITYYPWATSYGSSDLDYGDQIGDDVVTSFSACVANFTVPRLVMEQQFDTRVRVYGPDGKKIIDIPLIDYALKVRGHYADEMGEQEYLDRNDKYDLVFFMDKNNRWVKTLIHIHSWTLIEQNADI